MPEVAAAVVKAALGGDMQAARLVLSRALPRSRPVAVDLPPLERADDAPAALAAILAAVSQGEIAPDEGAALAALVERWGQAFERADLERRVAALEAQEIDGDGQPPARVEVTVLDAPRPPEGHSE